MTAEIRVRDAASFAPARIEKLGVRLQPLAEDGGVEAASENTPPREIAFVPDETDESVWRASLGVQAPGPYALEANYTAGGRSGTITKQFAAVAPLSLEQATARDALGRAARETGGEILTGDDAGSALARRFNAASVKPERTQHVWEVRSWWPLAFIIPLLLSAAWLLERIWMRADR